MQQSLRMILLSGLLAGMLIAGLRPRAGADSPPSSSKPLSSEQQERLKERDRWAAELKELRKQAKLSDAIAAGEKMLAIEREVFGNVHEKIGLHLFLFPCEVFQLPTPGFALGG